MALRRTLILLVSLLAALAATAQEPAEAVERRIKAAFLYKFAEYVDWPANAFASVESPLVIGVAGADVLASELEQAVAERRVAGRSVKVRRLAPGEHCAADCHVLFVGGTADRASRTQMLSQANAKPVLTVTEDGAEHFPGSIITFVVTENRVRFDISRGQAERNGLQIGSQLLRVARNVEPR